MNWYPHVTSVGLDPLVTIKHEAGQGQSAKNGPMIVYFGYHGHWRYAGPDNSADGWTGWLAFPTQWQFV